MKSKTNNMKKLTLIAGAPASGKSTYTKQLVAEGYTNINRDMYDLPGKVYSSKDFHNIQLRQLMSDGTQSIVVDNTYPTIQSRQAPIELAKEYGYSIECWVMDTKPQDVQFNAAMRMINKYGKLVDKKDNEITLNDSNTFGPEILFSYWKKFEAPSKEHGFDDVKMLAFKRDFDPKYTNKAIILDYDGTLRETISGFIYPKTPDDIKILPNRKKILTHYKNDGYLLLGVSNQSGIHKGILTEETADQCFRRTNKLIGLDIDYRFCKHASGPASCYCRKPMPGHGVEFIMKYLLDPKQCIMVGDMTTDKTFATRCGFQYIDQSEFFKL